MENHFQIHNNESTITFIALTWQPTQSYTTPLQGKKWQGQKKLGLPSFERKQTLPCSQYNQGNFFGDIDSRSPRFWRYPRITLCLWLPICHFFCHRDHPAAMNQFTLSQRVSPQTTLPVRRMLAHLQHSLSLYIMKIGQCKNRKVYAEYRQPCPCLINCLPHMVSLRCVVSIPIQSLSSQRSY